MVIDSSSILIAVGASILSGIGTALVANIADSKKEKNRRYEKAQDDLKMELKDLQIKLYQLEIDLTEWKDRYYEAIQELIHVKSELEIAMIKLNYIQAEES
jgi:hypothetical protein